MERMPADHSETKIGPGGSLEEPSAGSHRVRVLNEPVETPEMGKKFSSRSIPCRRQDKHNNCEDQKWVRQLSDGSYSPLVPDSVNRHVTHGSYPSLMCNVISGWRKADTLLTTRFHELIPRDEEGR